MKTSQKNAYPPISGAIRLIALFLALLAVTACWAIAYQNHEESNSASAATPPDHIVNGDFEYLGGLPPLLTNQYFWYYISIDDRTALRSTSANARIALPSSFAGAKFGWRNTTTLNNTVLRPGDVQINCSAGGNHYVDLVTEETKKCIYQDISTTPGSVYKWALKHTSAGRGNNTMQVMIGNASKLSTLKAQNAERIHAPSGVPLGNVGTSITSSTAGWHTYTGAYLVPAGQTRTRFTFNDVVSTTSGSGNIMDDISFSIADPLNYNLNGGTGNLPKPQASGTYPGYYQRGSSVVLSEIVPVRSGYTFLGWSDTKYGDITSAFQAQTVAPTIVKKHTIHAGTNTVYAVWGKNPIITFVDGVTNETVSSTTVPFASDFTESIIPPVSPVHDWYDFVGYDKILPIGEKIHEDTIITLNYARNDLIEIPAKIEWRDNNDYAGLRPESVTLCLLADGIEIATQSVGASTDWNHVFNNLPAHDDTDGHLISYTVIRKATSGIPDSYSSVDETVSIENSSSTGLSVEATYVATISIPVTKIWDDMDDIYGERPNEIIVTLSEKVEDEWVPYANIHLRPEVSEEKEQEAWQAAFTDIPLWDAETEEMKEWRIEEPEVYGYDLVSVDANGSKLSDGFTLTNRIWKHIDMPETGGNGVLVWVWIIASSLIIFTMIGTIATRTRLS